MRRRQIEYENPVVGKQTLDSHDGIDRGWKMLEDVIEDDGIEWAIGTQILREEPRINSEAAVARHSTVGSRLVALHDHPATLRGFEKPPFSATGLEQARILKGLVTTETIEQRFEILRRRYSIPSTGAPTPGVRLDFMYRHPGHA
jgi:hypothetical protein